MWGGQKRIEKKNQDKIALEVEATKDQKAKQRGIK